IQPGLGSQSASRKASASPVAARAPRLRALAGPRPPPSMTCETTGERSARSRVASREPSSTTIAPNSGASRWASRPRSVRASVGRLTRARAGRAAEIVAVDVSEEMLARAREHNAHLSNVRWIHGDGTSLRPLADGSVDACVSVVVFQHIPDPAVTLGYVREM